MRLLYILLFLLFGVFSPGFVPIFGKKMWLRRGQMKLSTEYIPRSEIRRGVAIGSGSFGSVHKGTWTHNGISRLVAIKKNRPFENEGTKVSDEINWYEVKAMITLANHPNIVQLYGVSGKDYRLIVEFMENGSLLSFLQSHRSPPSLTISQLLYICIQVCNGMVHMERKNLVHRDLSARNCLVGHNFVVKVSDFGLTRSVSDPETVSGQMILASISAPEVIDHSRFSAKSDVYAFGYLMWEVFTFGEPIPYLKENDDDAFLNPLSKPFGCPYDIYHIMELCWQYYPNERPTFSQLLNSLNSLYWKYLRSNR